MNRNGGKTPQIDLEYLREAAVEYFGREVSVGDLEELFARANELAQADPAFRRELATLEARYLEVRHGITELQDRMLRPYIPSPELDLAKRSLDILAVAGRCNAIILEGPPGTGKTQWAYSEVGELLQAGEDAELIHVRVKDTMRALDLLYTVDHVRRLGDANGAIQLPEPIRTEAEEWRQRILNSPAEFDFNNREYLSFERRLEAVTRLSKAIADLDIKNYITLGELGEAILQSSVGKKVWLILDELEKGRPELATGILDEIENLTFTIAETGEVIRGDFANLRIVVNINPDDSEKIPSSFKRRSLYLFMDYPDRERLTQIIRANFQDIDEELLDYALSIFFAYHAQDDIVKPPSTPELLAWIQVMAADRPDVFDLNHPVPHKEVLLKESSDVSRDLKLGESVKPLRNEVRIGVPHYLSEALRGECVIRLDLGLISDERHQESKLFTSLASAGIVFSTPKSDDYGEMVNQFNIFSPGFKSLGDGYFTVPKERLPIFLDYMWGGPLVLVNSSGEDHPYRFDNVVSSTKEYTEGNLYLDEKSTECVYGYVFHGEHEGVLVYHGNYDSGSSGA